MDKKIKPVYRDYVVMIRFQHLEKPKGDNRGIEEIRSDNEQFVSFKKGELYIEKTYVNTFRMKEDEQLEQRQALAARRTIEMFKSFYPTGVLAPQLFIENENLTSQFQHFLEHST